MADQPSSDHHAPLAIADAPYNAATETRTLNVQDGTPIKLDELGPMIVNSNGTLSRISNWSTLTQGERDRTVRLLVKKRNLDRMRKLASDEAGAAAGSAPTGGESSGNLGAGAGLVSALTAEQDAAAAPSPAINPDITPASDSTGSPSG